MSNYRDCNTRVRIDFVVREVSPDNSIPEEELRFVRFGEDVAPHDVKDFFDRSSMALSLMFRSGGPQALVFTRYGSNKINTIKLVRELGGYGLKEAKDLVEGPLGTAILIVNDSRDVTELAKRFREVDVEIEMRPYNPNRNPPASIPQAQEYKPFIPR